MNFNLTPLTQILTAIKDFINFLVPVVFAIALIVFIWGIFRFFIAGGASEEKRNEGKQLAFWAIIGFTIMVSVWGLVNLLVTTFGFDTKTRPCLPTFDKGCVSLQAFPHSPLAHIDVVSFQHIL